MIEAGDVRGAIDQLDSRFPGFRDRLLDPAGNLRQFVNVYLNDEDVRFGSGLDSKLEERDEVSIIQPFIHRWRQQVGGVSIYSNEAAHAVGVCLNVSLRQISMN